ncbi:hypothetical protein [Cognatilysobacter terrigena]|uniref:hypothetical protein n=1 Tax=Cognatilysobacter terrigena TaxID=2488749 RepID=UPI0010605330|nr:hypothetical protein [Lysobacter terrigena]
MTFDRSQISGWGADLDRANRPAVPMERQPPRLENVHWDIPEPQRQTVEVLHSIERPGITPVFGSACPPSGLSGKIRRAAFRHSEGRLRHWMMLLLADRVNVIEGLFDDARHSKRVHTIAAVGLVGLVAMLWLRKS